MGKRRYMAMMQTVDTTGTRARNLILVGFMGTGKTSVGMRVAKSLGFDFVDTDQLIVEKAGKPIPRIFEEDGESVFRKMETDILRECLKRENQVIPIPAALSFLLRILPASALRRRTDP